MTTRQAQWAKGRTVLIVLDEESRKKLNEKVQVAVKACDKDNNSKSSIVRNLIKIYL